MKRTGLLLLALLYLTVCLLPFRPFFPRFTTHLIADHGDALLQHLHSSWQWLALAEGRAGEMLALPTMAPYGSGLAFGEPLVGVVLPFLPVYLLTGSTPAAFNSAVVCSFLLLGLATFLLTRELVGSTPGALLAALLVLFPPWRLHYLSAVNVLTLHYAVLGMWLVARWLHRGGLGVLLAAALFFQLQLVTSAQNGVPAVYLVCVWLAVEWLGRRRPLDARRCVQLAAAGGLFVGLSLPWLAFFGEAFQARSGQLPIGRMVHYSESFSDMAALMGVTGWLGAAAALALVALPLGLRRGLLDRHAALALLGISLGAALLFVIGRGPLLGADQRGLPLPGFYASQLLPFLSQFRAPIRLAGLSPLALALLAGAGLAVVDAATRARRSAVLRWSLRLLPLLCALGWPPLDPTMGAPIHERPHDLALARALEQLPADARILSLPMAFGPSGAAVDERVLVHRRRQVSGFASVAPIAFRQAARALGDWPYDGLEIAAALETTHLLLPGRWLDRHREAAEARGYREIARIGNRAVVGLPELPAASDIASGSGAPGEWSARVPARAATDRWLTLQVTRSAAHFEPRGHFELEGIWRSTSGAVTRVTATALMPGVVSPTAAVRVHVPTPTQPGRYELSVPFPGLAIRAPVTLAAQPTSFDGAIRGAHIALASPLSRERHRAGGSFSVEVDVTAGPGAILLASSRHVLPERQGETLLVAQYRQTGRPPATKRLNDGETLGHDLLPGERARRRWTLLTPRRPGHYDVYVRLVARHAAEPPMPWLLLLRDLELAPD